MRRLTRSLRRARALLLPAALLGLGACERVTGPQAIEQAMKLERDIAAGKANVSTFATRFASLQRNGDAAPVRVIVDGVEREYWAFVFDRDYVPSRGNDPNAPFDRRRAYMILWRPEDPSDSYIVQAGPARAPIVAPTDASFWFDRAPRSMVTDDGVWLSTSGENEIARLQDSVATCDGLIDAATDASARHQFMSYSSFPDEFGPDPKITCARARFTVSATAVLQERVWGATTATKFGPSASITFKPAQRHFEIPPQTVPGTRLVVACNGTRQSAEVGCGPQTRPEPRHDSQGRPLPLEP